MDATEASLPPPFSVHTGWLDPGAADRLFHELLELPWEQHHVRLFGRTHPEPRLTLLLGDAGLRYRYSGGDRVAVGWPRCLQGVRERLRRAGLLSNAVLANQYRDGADHVGWHSDDERDLVQHGQIATLVLGSDRRVRFRTRRDSAVERRSRELCTYHGDLYLMSIASQRYWQHCVPATRRAVAPRLGLTFRLLVQREAPR